MVKQKPLGLSKIRLSVALATFNEEKCLKECLESVKGLADEVVVVDGSSVDKTVEIAKLFGAKVIVTDNKPVFHINKQKAIDECNGEWVLQLDADEVVTPELAGEIEKIVEQNNDFPTAYWIKRKKMFLGRWIKKGGQYPDPVIRLFRKGKAYLPCKSVHEQMSVNGTVGQLENHLLHFPTPSFAVYITKDNRYSTLSAIEMDSKSAKINGINFLRFFFWEPSKIFFSLYFRHRGFLDGFPGFVFAYYSGLHKTTAFVKYWEMKKTSGIEVGKERG